MTPTEAKGKEATPRGVSVYNSFLQPKLGPLMPPPPRRHTFTPHTVQSNPRTLHFTILIQISAARTRPHPGCSVFSSTIPPLPSSSEKKKPMPVSPLAKISVCFFSLRLHQSLSEALLLADAHVSVCFLRLQTSKPPFFFLDTVVSVRLTDSSQVL